MSMFTQQKFKISRIYTVLFDEPSVMLYSMNDWRRLAAINLVFLCQLTLYRQEVGRCSRNILLIIFSPFTMSNPVY